jgi:hypothetical protein
LLPELDEWLRLKLTPFFFVITGRTVYKLEAQVTDKLPDPFAQVELGHFDIAVMLRVTMLASGTMEPESS